MTTTLFTGVPARDCTDQQVIFKRFEVNFSDGGIATGVARAALPSGAIIIGSDVNVQTVFNAATTNVLTVGSNSTAFDNVIAAGDVAEGTAALTQNIKPTGTALGPLTADTTFYAKYTQTGTAATTGKAQVIIKYVQNESTP